MLERKVVSVSIPRSGHHMLQRILSAYFEPRFHYCETYLAADCCRTFPCRRDHGENAVFLQKTHDFNGKVPILRHALYLVQVRHIVPQTLSYFDYWLSHESTAGLDSEEAFGAFALDRLRRYKSFFGRWVRRPAESNIRLLVYERVMQNPIDEFAGVVEVLDDGRVDRTRLMSAVEREQVALRRDIRRHRYYGSDVLRFIENEAAREIAFLGLPRLF